MVPKGCSRPAGTQAGRAPPGTGTPPPCISYANVPLLWQDCSRYVHKIMGVSCMHVTSTKQAGSFFFSRGGGVHK